MKIELLKPKELKNVQYRAISYGAGTQSTAMMIMGLEGELHAKPDIAIFADTGAEPKHVYEYLEIIKKHVKEKYNLDIITVKNGDLEKQILNTPLKTSKKTGKQYLRIAPPLYLKGEGGKPDGIMRRQCTYEHKIIPFRKYLKKQLGIRMGKFPNGGVEIWMGISYDEIARMKPSLDWWAIKRYPLIENMMRRKQSIDYVVNHGLPEPPRSSCHFCPFHEDRYWRFLKNNHPDDFNKAVRIDEIIRKLPQMKNKTYVHKSRMPLRDIDFEILGNQIGMDADGFINECEGYCGI